MVTTKQYLFNRLRNLVHAIKLVKASTRIVAEIINTTFPLSLCRGTANILSVHKKTKLEISRLAEESEWHLAGIRCCRCGNQFCFVNHTADYEYFARCVMSVMILSLKLAARRRLRLLLDNKKIVRFKRPYKFAKNLKSTTNVSWAVDLFNDRRRTILEALYHVRNKTYERNISQELV